MKHTEKFPKYEGGDNYSIDLIFDNEATISIDRRSRYSEECVMSREEMESNALLISKAPELLHMLQHIVMNFESDYLVDGIIVDSPYEWLQDRYKEAKELIKKSTTI